MKYSVSIFQILESVSLLCSDVHVVVVATDGKVNDPRVHDFQDLLEKAKELEDIPKELNQKYEAQVLHVYNFLSYKYLIFLCLISLHFMDFLKCNRYILGHQLHCLDFWHHWSPQGNHEEIQTNGGISQALKEDDWS